MTSTFPHALPWTEGAYLALGETTERVELFDGSLFIGSSATPLHQRVTARLIEAISPATYAAGLDVFTAVNVRLRPGRIVIPDLVVTVPVDLDELVVDAASVVLVGETAWPTTATIDRVLKMRCYAAAGIEWFLLVDTDPVALTLHRLEGEKYVEVASGAPGRPLGMAAPIETDIDPSCWPATNHTRCDRDTC